MPLSAQMASAHHEAGHAVAALLNGVRFLHVTIESENRSGGHIWYLNAELGMEQAHKRAAVALAGEAAQRRFSAQSLVDYHGAVNREAVLRFAHEFSGSADQAQLLLKLWHVQALEFAETHWAGIQRVAAALIEYRVLDASAVAAIMQPRATRSKGIK